MGDKGEGGVKNLKKWVMSFVNGPYLLTIYCLARKFEVLNAQSVHMQTQYDNKFKPVCKISAIKIYMQQKFPT